MVRKDNAEDIMVSLLLLLETLKEKSSTYISLKDSDYISVNLRVGLLKEAESTLEKVKEFFQ